MFAGLEPPPLTKEDKAELRAAAAEAKAEREAVQAIEREAEAERRRAEAAAAAARLAEWQAEAGPPMAPQNPTGWYLCAKLDRAFFPVGSGPWPDYRPPGLAWERRWAAPKPDGVPWSDELPPPKAWAPDPKPIRETTGKVQQMRLFG